MFSAEPVLICGVQQLRCVPLKTEGLAYAAGEGDSEAAGLADCSLMGPVTTTDTTPATVTTSNQSIAPSADCGELV